MSDPVRFLTGLSRALSMTGLYGHAHPAAARAIDDAYSRLLELQDATPTLEFTFLPGEVLFGRELVADLERWEWSDRFSASGLERLEVTGPVEAEQFARFLTHTAVLTGLRDERPDIWQAGPCTIRFGRVRVDGGDQVIDTASLTIATLDYSLRQEQDAIAFVHDEVAAGGKIPLLEAQGVVGSLSLAMHGGQGLVVPLLELKEFDEYTTTHSINVAVLSMALAEFVGLGPNAARAVGLGGLLHDLGKVRIPREILNKPGMLSREERVVIEGHPADGARLMLDGVEPLDLAAAVAYEHHLCADGRGYPHLHFPRSPHYASRLVHVCDVYDALRTRRPYRDAWTSEQALTYIRDRAGSEFDPAMVTAFTEMMSRWDQRIAVQPA